jgi:hypothetical protein
MNSWRYLISGSIRAFCLKKAYNLHRQRISDGGHLIYLLSAALAGGPQQIADALAPSFRSIHV